MKKSNKKYQITRVLRSLKLSPFHFILLSFFYIIHNFLYYRGILIPNEFVMGFLKLVIIQVFFYFLFYYRFRSHTKSGLLLTIGSALFLFFGNIKDTLHSLPFLNLFSSYTILLPVLFVLCIIVLKKIIKTNSFKNITSFLNLLFSVLIIVELYYLINPKRSYQTNIKELISTAVNVPSQIHPDIYYLVFDSYPSSSFLKEALQISNTFLDTSLTNRKFFIPQNSSSFYNYTAFSIASTFSMDKLHWLGSISSPKPEHFSEAVNQIKNAPLLAFLKKSGYSFSNLSFFDLQDNKAITAKKLFYLAPPDLIFRNSLFTRFKWQIIPKIFPSYINVLIKDQSKNIINTLNDFKGYNKIVLKTLQQCFLLNNKYPKFTYAHFGMPHFPFIYDSTGSEFPITEPYDYSFKKNKAKYQSYLVYVNKIIINLVDEILNKNETPPVIIIQSDHGCQEYNFVKETSDVFRNYTAYYFPDNNYSMLNKEMNNINTFRIVLNKYFDQKLKMLKDTSIYLKF